MRAPWPGALPSPAPAVVLRRPVAATVVDGEGRPVTIDRRGGLCEDPAEVTVEAGTDGRGSGRTGPGLAPAASPVVEWAGPWPVDERWWDPATHRCRARFQVVTGEGTALLLSVEDGRWWVEAIYD
jgi:protein ImuB